MPTVVGPSELVEALRRYLESGDARPVWLGDLPFEPQSDRGMAFLLLASALRGLVPDSRLGPALLGLWERFGQDLFRLSHEPFETVAEWVIGRGGIEGLPDHPSQKIPGVLRSVSDFFFSVGSLNRWLRQAGSGEVVVRQLAESVFWMGKASPYRNKPRYFLWLLHAAQVEATHLLETAHPPVSPGHFRWLGEFGDAKLRQFAYALSPSARLAFFSSMTRSLGIASPWIAVPAYEAWLERQGPNALTCRTLQGGCPRCPLHTLCPAARLVQE